MFGRAENKNDRKADELRRQKAKRRAKDRIVNGQEIEDLFCAYLWQILRVAAAGDHADSFTGFGFVLTR